MNHYIVVNLLKYILLLRRLMHGAFTTERLEVVQMLSSQIAISFQNAMLVKSLQDANQLLEQKNTRLLELDLIKDQFLANTSHELR